MNLNEIEGRSEFLESTPTQPAARRWPQHTLSDLLIPISCAIDLAEGRPPGHAQRVAYIAMALANTLDLDRQSRLACCYAGLLHDIGVITASSGLSAVTEDERLLFASLPLLAPEEAAYGSGENQDMVVQRIMDHAVHGARAAQELGLPTDAIRAIAAHHENWDGSGYPHALSGEDVPLVGRVVALADHIESMIGQAPPLVARRSLPVWLGHLGGGITDPQTSHALRLLSNGDDFWLGLNSSDLQIELTSICSRLREPRSSRLVPFAEAFAHLVDSRFDFTAGVSAQVAQLSGDLGRALGLNELRLRQLHIAALLHDVGQLAVGERIMAKPGILTVEELEVLRVHPHYSQEVVAGIQGLEEVATWVGAHHERLDGRGYPEALPADEIPLESRILAVADAYVAITSDRPHRPRSSAEDAVRRLRSAAGTQLDADVVDIFLKKVVA